MNKSCLQALVAIVVTAFFALVTRPAHAQATPSGPSQHPCLRGEGTSAPIPNGRGSCFACSKPPTTQNGGAVETKKKTVVNTPSEVPPGDWWGADYYDKRSSEDATGDEPGGAGGLEAHSGAYTVTVSLPGGSAGFG